MISIVLPVYNGEKYISEAIKSILNQTYRDFELIVVNDCSTDGTMDILKCFCKENSNIRVINNSSNQRLPKSLNIGFAVARGEYLTWTSDDNILEPIMLERLIKTIKETGSDLVFAKCQLINQSGKKVGITKNYYDLDEIYYENIVRACFLYKKDVQETLGGYDVSKFLVEDYDFWLRAYKKFRFVFLPETLYRYRIHDNNLSSQRMEEVSIRRIEILKKNICETKRKDIKNSIIREIGNSYFDASNAYYNKLKTQNDRKTVLIMRLKDTIKKMIKRS